MAFGVWQKSVRDLLGANAASDAKVYVTREGSGLPATLYGDREGAELLPNPLTVQADGYFRFYALGGRHKVVAYRGSLDFPTDSTIWRDVPIGTAQEIDTDFLAEPGYQYNYVELLTVPPNPSEIRFNNLNLSLATEAYVHAISLSGQDTTQRLLDLDSAGKTLPNSINIVASQVGFSYLVIAAVDMGDYIKLTLDNPSGAVDIEPQRVTLQREISGADGTDPGLLYTYDNPTAAANPGTGRVRFNNLNLSLATKAYVSISNRASNSLTARLLDVNNWGNAGFRAIMGIVRSGAPGEATFNVSLATDNSGSGYITFDITHKGGLTALVDEDLISLQLIPVGLAGAGFFKGTEIVKTANYTAVAADRGQHIVFNSATPVTLAFDPAVTLGNNWMAFVSNIGVGTLTLNPDAAETINGVATIGLRTGQSGLVSSTGAVMRLILRERAKLSHLDDVDLFTTPPANGDGFVWDNTAQLWKPGPAGGGMFKGDNGTVGTRSGDIFRINKKILSANVTIAATENASAAGPLEVATGITLEVATGGTLVIL